MGLFINTNLSAINAQNQLSQTSNSLGRSFERLSSGLRINGARDDAAGLSITTRFSSQIRGLNQAVRNSNDGISLAQTAEGALNETTNILQRMRELSVQSANDTNNSADRGSIQAEIAQLKTELDRIATTTNFNGNKILNGGFLAKDLQVGANVGETITVGIADARTDSLARQTRVTGTSGVDTTTGLAAGDIQFVNDPATAGVPNGNGPQTTSIRAAVQDDDQLSTTRNAASAIAKAAAINDAYQFTGVRAIVGDTTLSGGGIGAVTLDETNFITVNGQRISGFAVQQNDSNGSLVEAINAVSDETGVVAALNQNSQLELTAADGRNIEVTVAGGATVTGLATTVQGGVLTLQSNNQYDALFVAGTDGALGGVTGQDGTNVFGINANSAISSVDVSTRAGALLALDSIDLALEQVSASRADLGALQNRLESTINNLSTTSENLSASRSRILDADFAQETAQLSRNQILQQAGVSILAQANQQPQVALSLLG